MPRGARAEALVVRASGVAEIATDQLPHRLPAADRVLPSGIRHLSCGLPFIFYINTGIGQSHHPEVLKKRQSKPPLKRKMLVKADCQGKEQP